MIAFVATAVTVLKLSSLALGGLITYYAYKAYRRTGSPALRALTLGFAAITFGAFTAGIVDQVVAVERTHALLVESAFTSGGFAIILYSLYAD